MADGTRQEAASGIVDGRLRQLRDFLLHHNEAPERVSYVKLLKPPRAIPSIAHKAPENTGLAKCICDAVLARGKKVHKP